MTDLRPYRVTVNVSGAPPAGSLVLIDPTEPELEPLLQKGILVPADGPQEAAEVAVDAPEEAPVTFEALEAAAEEVGLADVAAE